MRNCREINKILNELDHKTADALEDQDLDFKVWNTKSRANAVNLVIEMAVCMANGGGGTVVFGIKDNIIGREKAILGIPEVIDVNKLKKAVYDATDPKLTPVFEEIAVPEGTGRILVMQVYPGLPPYTDTSGRGKIRVGKDCQPLTGTLRRRIMIETGETDYTTTKIPGRPESHISAAALEKLREASRQEHAPMELLKLSDIDLLTKLDLLHNGRLTMAGLLLAGNNGAIKTHLPGYGWTHLRMRSDTEYKDRMDDQDALPLALLRITDRIMVDNPITTVEHGLFHFEYRTYPEIALREAIMNALCHSNYHIPSIILIKQYPHKLEITNPGGFIGGISPHNILHHKPVARNPLLVEALTKLRLVNRSNLGIPRMFTALLIEGKEPPLIEDQGEAVKVTFLAREISAPFRIFIAKEGKRGRIFTLDHLLILRYLIHHPEIETPTAAEICQRQEREIREILSEMERNFGYLERGGTGRGTYWSLSPTLHQHLQAPGQAERDQRIDWEAAKTRVLSVLKQRAKRHQPGLSNAEIRQVTHFDRNQVFRLMRELVQENPKVSLTSKGRHAKYQYGN